MEIHPTIIYKDGCWEMLGNIHGWNVGKPILFNEF
jgi:hypothetical protein